jgi:hypothetical protein
MNYKRICSIAFLLEQQNMVFGLAMFSVFCKLCLLKEAKSRSACFGLGKSNRVFLAYSQISQTRGIAVYFFLFA